MSNCKLQTCCSRQPILPPLALFTIPITGAPIEFALGLAESTFVFVLHGSFTGEWPEAASVKASMLAFFQRLYVGLFTRTESKLSCSFPFDPGLESVAVVMPNHSPKSQLLRFPCCSPFCSRTVFFNSLFNSTHSRFFQSNQDLSFSYFSTLTYFCWAMA